MILVVLGTWEKPFTRPLQEIELAIETGLIKDDVIVQGGKTEFDSKYMKIVPFFDRIELEDLYNKADLIICQAGAGSIMMGMEKNKKIISIARLKKFDEHIDDHQKEILDVFSKNNYIIPWGGGNLPAILEKVAAFKPEKYPFGNHKIEDSIIKYIEENLLNN